MDDIAIATCSPNMSFTPSPTATVCNANTVEIGGKVRSFFNNYVNYKWQRSTDNGTSWQDAGAPGSATPALIDGEYEYDVTYPQFTASSSDNGNRYRLVVATNPTELAGASCVLSGNTDLALTVDNCVVLNTSLLSFTAKADTKHSILKWTTSTEYEPLEFLVEKSLDGKQYTVAARVSSREQYSSSFNNYTWSEEYQGQKVYYRIRMLGKNNGEKFSKIVVLGGTSRALENITVQNPFKEEVVLQITSAEAKMVKLDLISNNGVVLFSQYRNLSAGMNKLVVENLAYLPSGIYAIRIDSGDDAVTRKLLKL
jgi:hypothetical protein